MHTQKAQADVHLRYTELTTDADVFVAEGWVSLNSNLSTDEEWIPRLMVHRQSENSPLASTFVALVEPYGLNPKITQVRRLHLKMKDGELFPDTNVAVKIQLANGCRDILVAFDMENPLNLTPSKSNNRAFLQEGENLDVDGELYWCRLNSKGFVK